MKLRKDEEIYFEASLQNVWKELYTSDHLQHTRFLIKPQRVYWKEKQNTTPQLTLFPYTTLFRSRQNADIYYWYFSFNENF